VTRSSTYGTTQVIDQVNAVYLPTATKDFVAGLLWAHHGRAEAGPVRRQELSERIRAAVAAECGPLTPGHLGQRATITRKNIAKRLDQHGLRRAPSLRTIGNVLREMLNSGCFGTETVLILGQSQAESGNPRR
jgi:hypothetical protein